MKYILAKDLPFAKAGTKVKIEFNEILIKTEKGSPFGYHQYSGQFLQHLIDCGWIKEDKPREFIVELYGKNYKLSRLVETEDGCMPKNDNNYCYIKVREVIE